MFTRKFQNHSDSLINFLILLLLISIFFTRFYFYFNYKDLWLDELALALSVKNFSLIDFFLKPLLYGQSAPLGFMLISELISSSSQPTVLELYFLPFISSLFLGIIAYFFMATTFDKKHSLIYLFFIATSYPLLYYSAEFKQYGVEALSSLILLFYYSHFRKELEQKLLLSFVLLSIFCLLFATTTIFVVAGIVLTLCIKIYSPKNIKNYIIKNKVTILGGIGFFFLYYFLYLENASIENMQTYWNKMFIPLEIDKFIIFYKEILTPTLSACFFMPMELFFIFFLSGLIVLFKIDKEICFCIIFTTLILCIASILHYYPIGHGGVRGTRMLLFWIPIAFIPITVLLNFVLEKIIRFKILISLIFIFLTLHALNVEKKFLLKGNSMQQTSKLIHIIEENYTVQDSILLYQSSEKAFEFYKKNASSNYIIFDRAKAVDFQLNEIISTEQSKNKERLFMLFSHYSIPIYKEVLAHFSSKNLSFIKITNPGAVLLIIDLKNKIN